MKTQYQIDLSLLPDTFDAIHIVLISMVLVLCLLLFVITLLLVFSLYRNRKLVAAEINKPAAEPTPLPVIPIPAAPTPTPVQAEPEVRIVEKIIEKTVPGPAPKPVILKEFTSDAASQLLMLLQKEARFIDFIKEDLTQQNDSDIGVAARIVHEGCVKVIKEHFDLTSVRQEPENSQITLAKGFDANQISLSGNITGNPPFTGTLIHKGWQVTAIRLPKITEGHNVNIIAPAEVEL